jgi:hypothetical protein
MAALPTRAHVIVPAATACEPRMLLPLIPITIRRPPAEHYKIEEVN